MSDLKIEHESQPLDDGNRDNLGLSKADERDLEKKFSKVLSENLSKNATIKTNNGSKMNTSSAAGQSSGSVKGGGSPFATNDNFAPSTQGRGGPGINSGNPAAPPASEPSGLPGAGSPAGSSGGAQAPPGISPTTGGVEGHLQRMEAQQSTAKLAEYDKKVPTKDLRSKEGLEKNDPWHVRQAKNLKQRAKENNKIPGLDLRKAELGSLFKKKTKNPSEKGMKGLVARVKKYAKKKNTWKWVVGGTGIGGAFFALMFIMFLLGALLIPHFVSNILEYQFVRMTRAAYESTKEVAAEQEADNSMSPTEKAIVQKEFGTLDNGETNPTLKAESEDLSPKAMNEVAKAEGSTSEFKQNYEDVGNGQEQLKSITTRDDATGEFKTEKISGGFQNGDIREPPDVTISTDATSLTKVVGTFDPSLGDSAVYQHEVQPVDVAEDGLADGGLDPNKYQDTKNQTAADEAIEADSENAIYDDGSVGQSGISNVDNAEQTVSNEFKGIPDNPAELGQVVAESGNLPSEVVDSVNNGFVLSALDKVASEVGDFLNPAAGKLIPLCIIDQGSKFNGPTAETQSTEAQRSAILTMAVADQVKRGSPYVTANMVGAESWKINGDPRSGGVQDSIPIERASGQKVDTTSQFSAEGAPLGGLATSGNILAALGVPFAGPLQSALDTICPAITNVWVNVGLGALNLTLLVIATIFTGPAGDSAEAGLEAAAEGGAATAADAASQEIVDEIAADSVTEETSSGFSTLKDFGNGTIKLGKAVGKQGKQIIIVGGLTAMATFAAKFIVISQSGILNGGLATGPQHDNTVDQGAGILANAMVGNAYGGRPLTNTESLQVQQDDNKTLAEVNASHTAYQRYLALSNPQSLASILLDRVAVNLDYGFFNSVMADVGNVFNPARLMPQVLFGGLSGQANAASTVDTQDYGNVQQGYSDAEYALIAKEPTYRIPSENEYHLFIRPDEEAQVEQTYSPCFTQSVAQLLSEGDIVRIDKQGDVSQTQGLCSPQNLGPHNPIFGDLVFRYRLSISYKTTIDILEGVAYANGKLG